MAACAACVCGAQPRNSPFNCIAVLLNKASTMARIQCLSHVLLCHLPHTPFFCPCGLGGPPPYGVRARVGHSRTALANHVAIPVLLTQPHIEAGQSQVDGVEAVSKDPGPSPCSPRRRRWLAPPRHFPLILLPNHSVLVPLHGDLNVSFIVPRLEDGSALLASRRCFSPDFHPFLNF